MEEFFTNVQELKKLNRKEKLETTSKLRKFILEELCTYSIKPDFADFVNSLGISKELIYYLFRSWESLAKQAGFEESCFHSSEELLQKVRDLKTELNKVPSFREFYVKYNIQLCTVKSLFSSWMSLLNTAFPDEDVQPHLRVSQFTNMVKSYFKGHSVIQEFQIKVGNKTYRIDYVIPEKGIAIELDGASHFDANFYENLSGDTFLHKQVDDIEKERAILSRFKLVRFKYFWPWKESVLAVLVGGGSQEYPVYRFSGESPIRFEVSEWQKRRDLIRKKFDEGLSIKEIRKLFDVDDQVFQRDLRYSLSGVIDVKKKRQQENIEAAKIRVSEIASKIRAMQESGLSTIEIADALVIKKRMVGYYLAKDRYYKLNETNRV